jgi:hypothetical protein
MSPLKAITSLRLCPDTTFALRHVGMIIRNMHTIMMLQLDLRTFTPAMKYGPE